MTNNVIDLGERRQIKALLAEVAVMQRQLDERAFALDPRVAERVAILLTVELRDRHEALLKTLKPLLLALLELQAIALGEAATLPIALAGVLSELDLAKTFPARVEARRATLFDEYQRARAAYGPELLELPIES